MPQFDRYLGIDYSGAGTPTSSLTGLRVYEAVGDQAPTEVHPPPSPRKYWTRHGLAEWLAMELRDGPPTLVGIDHAFSFPIRYFEVRHIRPEWPVFLDDFCHHGPTDEDKTNIGNNHTRGLILRIYDVIAATIATAACQILHNPHPATLPVAIWRNPEHNPSPC